MDQILPQQPPEETNIIGTSILDFQPWTSWTSTVFQPSCDDKFLFFKPLSLGYVVKAVLENEHPNYSLSGFDVL